tara:strand:- start:55 stop:237 length:183 start_codon:yes stop_codon:yes gene_type:complete
MALKDTAGGGIKTNLSDEELKRLFNVKDVNDILKIKPHRLGLPRIKVKKEEEKKKRKRRA